MSSRADVDIMVTRDGLLDMASQYLADHDPKDPLASPVYGDFRGLPPLLLLVGGDEVLLDDAVRVAVAAGTGDTDATLFIGAGMQHVWPTWAGAFPEADDAIATIGSWVSARVGQDARADRRGGASAATDIAATKKPSDVSASCTLITSLVLPDSVAVCHSTGSSCAKRLTSAAMTNTKPNTATRN